MTAVKIPSEFVGGQIVSWRLPPVSRRSCQRVNPFEGKRNGGQPLFLLGNVAGLLCRLCLLNRPDKFSAVVLGVISNRPEHIGNKVQNRALIDTVLCGTEDAHRRLAVIGTGILRNTLAVVHTVDIHLCAAVGTVEKSGQRSTASPQPSGYRFTFPRIRCTLSKVSWSMIASWVFSKIVHLLSST